MGMFDYVNYIALCPKCDTVNKLFQSKDGPCTMSEVKPTDVKHFYGPCNKCRHWMDFEVIPTAYEIRMT